MRLEDLTRFRTLVTDALAYYGKDCTPFVLNVWWVGCSRFDYEQVVKALQKHAMDAQRGQFAPKVADIVRLLDGTHTDRAAMAWSKVHTAMSDVGAYTDVVFDDPAIHAVVEDMGGWAKVCRWPLDELSYLQHRFSEAYRSYVAQDSFQFPARLGGERCADVEYERKGLPPPMPVLVGDARRAQEVYRLGGASSAAGIGYTVMKALSHGQGATKALAKPDSQEDGDA